MQQLPKVIEPDFSTPEPNSPIQLYEGDLKIVWEGATLVHRGVIDLSWLPTPKIGYRIELDRIIVPPQGPLRIELADGDRTFSGYGQLGGFRASQDGNTMLLLGNIVGEVTPHPEHAQSGKFYLVNFHDYIGRGVEIRSPEGNAGWYAGRFRIQTKDWVVTIDAVSQSSNLHQQLRDTKGYGITHVGTIERTDGSEFLVSESEELLRALTYMLAFFRGNWVGPILVTYDLGDATWLDYKVRNISTYIGASNWFPIDIQGLDDELDRLFEQFMDLWNDQLWQQVIRTLTFWYVEAGVSAGPDASIILLATALELIFWAYCVESPLTKVLSGSAAEKKYGSLEDKIKLLLEQASIPEEIPDYFADLRGIAQEIDSSDQDGPRTFCKLRNRIVHPKRSYRNRMTTVRPYARFQAQQLGLLYIEKLFLHILEYGGPCNVRDQNFEIIGG